MRHRFGVTPLCSRAGRYTTIIEYDAGAANSGANSLRSSAEVRDAEDQHLIRALAQLALQLVGRRAEAQLGAHLQAMHGLRFGARIEQRAHAERSLRIAARLPGRMPTYTASAGTCRSRLAATASVERRATSSAQ